MLYLIQKLNIQKSIEKLGLYFINIYERSILGPLQADYFNLLAVNNLKFSTMKNFPSTYRSFKLSFKKECKFFIEQIFVNKDPRIFRKSAETLIFRLIYSRE